MSEGMSADAKEAAKRALTRRARDFVTLVACFGAILFLMWLTDRRKKSEPEEDEAVEEDKRESITGEGTGA